MATEAEGGAQPKFEVCVSAPDVHQQLEPRGSHWFRFVDSPVVSPQSSPQSSPRSLGQARGGQGRTPLVGRGSVFQYVGGSRRTLSTDSSATATESTVKFHVEVIPPEASHDEPLPRGALFRVVGPGVEECDAELPATKQPESADGQPQAQSAKRKRKRGKRGRRGNGQAALTCQIRVEEPKIAVARPLRNDTPQEASGGPELFRFVDSSGPVLAQTTATSASSASSAAAAATAAKSTRSAPDKPLPYSKVAERHVRRPSLFEKMAAQAAAVEQRDRPAPLNIVITKETAAESQQQQQQQPGHIRSGSLFRFVARTPGPAGDATKDEPAAGTTGSGGGGQAGLAIEIFPNADAVLRLGLSPRRAPQPARVAAVQGTLPKFGVFRAVADSELRDEQGDLIVELDSLAASPATTPREGGVSPRTEHIYQYLGESVEKALLICVEPPTPRDTRRAGGADKGADGGEGGDPLVEPPSPALFQFVGESEGQLADGTGLAIFVEDETGRTEREVHLAEAAHGPQPATERAASPRLFHFVDDVDSSNADRNGGGIVIAVDNADDGNSDNADDGEAEDEGEADGGSSRLCRSSRSSITMASAGGRSTSSSRGSGGGRARPNVSTTTSARASSSASAPAEPGSPKLFHFRDVSLVPTTTEEQAAAARRNLDLAAAGIGTHCPTAQHATEAHASMLGLGHDLLGGTVAWQWDMEHHRSSSGADVSAPRGGESGGHGGRAGGARGSGGSTGSRAANRSTVGGGLVATPSMSLHDLVAVAADAAASGEDLAALANAADEGRDRCRDNSGGGGGDDDDDDDDDILGDLPEVRAAMELHRAGHSRRWVSATMATEVLADSYSLPAGGPDFAETDSTGTASSGRGLRSLATTRHGHRAQQSVSSSTGGGSGWRRESLNGMSWADRLVYLSESSMEEFLRSEEAFVNLLLVLEEAYLPLFADEDAPERFGIIQPVLRSFVFALPELVAFHRGLLADLSACATHEQLLSAFAAQSADLCRVYRTYHAGLQRLLQGTLQRREVLESSALREALLKVASSARCGSGALSFVTLAYLPAQRLDRYRVHLGDLQLHLTNLGSEVLRGVRTSQDHVAQALAAAAEYDGLQQAAARAEIQFRFQSLVPVCADARRELVRAGVVPGDVGGRSRLLHVFLLDNAVVIARQQGGGAGGLRCEAQLDLARLALRRSGLALVLDTADQAAVVTLRFQRREESLEWLDTFKNAILRRKSNRRRSRAAGQQAAIGSSLADAPAAARGHAASRPQAADPSENNRRRSALVPSRGSRQHDATASAHRRRSLSH